MENKPTMLSYIYQEQETMLKILSTYPANVKDAVKRIGDKSEEWLVLATGSSINAARSAKYYIEKCAQVRIDIQEPYNYCKYETINPHLDVVLGVSQSGQSTSTIEALQRIQKQSELTTISVTSRPNSEITEVTTATLDIGCGQEKVGYVTMGFTSTVLTMMLMGLHLGVKKGLITPEQEKDEIENFINESHKINDIIKKSEDFIQSHIDDFKDAHRITGVAFGSIVGTIKEFETKFCETVRVPTAGYDLEAYMHGPYLEVNPEHRIFFVEAKSTCLEKLHLLKAYESKHSTHVYTVSTASQATDNHILALDIDLDEYKAPYLLIIPFQIFAWYVSKSKGIDLTHRIYTDFSQAVKSKTTVQDYV